ncbi:hypothetical protein GE061_000995 [Apolygus lucorum]|uniref:HTH psq-type domain-containing protein n=1 Tax=Apolygus lucorum TaxID=248454 RepID=A0A8S9Y7E0_APOLU|nr:hypothetical protein GE061_000995 [Apolygus lucorum]
MPRSENGVKRPPVDKQKLELAVNEVLKGMSINECSKIHNIGRWTISRHLTNFKEQNSENFEYKNNCGHRKVFTDDEEKDLVNYLLLASRIYFGITKRGLSTLAFEFARQNGKHFPKTWHDNAKAGKQWVQDFLIRVEASRLEELMKEKAVLTAKVSFQVSISKKAAVVANISDQISALTREMNIDRKQLRCVSHYLTPFGSSEERYQLKLLKNKGSMAKRKT